jgi:hypothetical protein
MGKHDDRHANPLKKWHKEQKKKEKEKRRNKNSAPGTVRKTKSAAIIPSEPHNKSQAKREKQMQRLEELYKLGQLDSLGIQQKVSLENELKRMKELQRPTIQAHAKTNLPDLPSDNRVPLFMVDGLLLEPAIPETNAGDEFISNSSQNLLLSRTEYVAAPQVHDAPSAVVNTSTITASKSAFVPASVRKSKQKRKEELQAEYLKLKEELEME